MHALEQERFPAGENGGHRREIAWKRAEDRGACGAAATIADIAVGRRRETDRSVDAGQGTTRKATRSLALPADVLALMSTA